jgi:hypothetical protein
LRDLPHWIRHEARQPPREMYRRIQQRLRCLAPHWLLRLTGGDTSTPAEPFREGSLWQIFTRAYEDYVAQPYSGIVTVFWARARPLFSANAKDLGWSRLAQGGVDVRIVRGNHGSIMHEPDVAGIAQELRDCLARLPVDAQDHPESML